MNYLDVPVLNGLLRITHLATGSFYLVTSINVRDAAIMANGQLKLGTYQNPRLQELYNESPDLDYTYTETESPEASRKLKHDIMAQHYGDDHLLNTQDWPKLMGVYRLTHVKSGKVYIGSTQDLIKQHNYQSTLLRTGKHKSTVLQELYDVDPEMHFGFSICRDMEQAKAVAKEWSNEAMRNGVSTNRNKADPVPTGIGCYCMTFTDSGMYYIGSSKKTNDRINWHRWALKNGKHSNPCMQKHYDRGNKEFTVTVDNYPTIEKAREAEQILLNLHTGDPQCLNLADDVRSPGSYIWSNPEHRKMLVAGIRKHKGKPEVRKSYGEKMKAWHAANKGKRDGGSNPFARKVLVYGVMYGSVIEAVRAINVGQKTLRKWLLDPTDVRAVYVA